MSVGAGGCGQVFQTGGTVTVQRVSYDQAYDFAIGGDPNNLVGQGEYNLSGGALFVKCYLLLGSAASSRGVLRVSGDGVFSNSSAFFTSIGTGTGSYGELNISGGKFFHTAGMNLGSSTGTGVLHITGGELRAPATLNLGWNQAAGVSRGQGTIGGGYVRVYGYGDGLSIGAVIPSTGSNQYTRGTLTMTNGTLEIKDTGQNGWGHLAGLVIGYANTNNSIGFSQGEFTLAGGAATNNGYLLIGYNQGATGTMTQAGGRYVQPASSYFIPSVVGYGGGSGTLIVSNGLFELSGANRPLYVGGCTLTNTIFRSSGATNIDLWASTAYRTALSSGRLEMAGGTLTIGGSLVVATNGQGTVVFSGGATTATNLFLNGPDATLRFNLGPTGAGTLSVTNMTIRPGSKLVVDASGYNSANGLRVKLVGCALPRTGAFAESDITVSGATAVVDQTSGSDIWLQVRLGTLIYLR
jgi:hypothetical protein